MSKLRIKKWMWVTLAVVVAFQIYFIRELVAAELLFGLLFGLGLLLAFLIFLAQEIGEWSMEWARPRAQGLAGMALRRLSQLEGISKKPFRRLRSESVR